MSESIIDRVASIQQRLLSRYGGQGKDLEVIREEGGMSEEDAIDHRFVLEKLAV